MRAPEFIEATTQKGVDRIIKAGDIPIVRSGFFTVTGDSASVQASGSASVEASGSASVEAWGSASVQAWGSASVQASGSASVQAWGSASVQASGSASVQAWDSASVQASGSASVRASGSASVQASGSASVEAWDSASVEAWGSASVQAWGSVSVQASRFVAVQSHYRYGKRPKVKGGVLIEIPKLDTAELWCEFYDVKVTKAGVATLFKAVRDDFRSSHGTSYEPGSKPEAPDWDGGVAECGGGLHFSPLPYMAKMFDLGATRYVACPVRLADIAVHPDGNYLAKVKAPRVVGRGCYEVDIDGKRL